MLTIALLHHHYDAAKLEAVKVEMAKLGTPTIKAVWSEMHGIWFALEGCHRLRAAASLGLTPEIEEIEVSDLDQDVNEVVPGAFEDPVTFGQILNPGPNPAILKF